MLRNQWLDELRSELRSQRLPASYVSGFMDEIAGHLDDILFQEKIEMSTDAINRSNIDARLGTPQALASAVGETYEYPTFAGRHPLLMFLLAPLPLFVTVVVAQCLLIGVLEWLGFVEQKTTTFSMLWKSMNYVPAVLATLWLCRCWQESERHWGWLLAATSCLAIAIAPFAATATVSSQPGKSLVGVGVRLSDSFHPTF